MLTPSDLAILVTDDLTAAAICDRKEHLESPTTIQVVLKSLSALTLRSRRALAESSVQRVTVRTSNSALFSSPAVSDLSSSTSTRSRRTLTHLSSKALIWHSASLNSTLSFRYSINVRLVSPVSFVIQAPGLLPRHVEISREKLVEACDKQRVQAEGSEQSICVVLIGAGVPMAILVMALSSAALFDNDEVAIVMPTWLLIRV